MGWDNEDTPSLGGIYLANIVSKPALRTIVGIGDPVPGGSPADRFTNFGEGLSFDGRYVAFEGSWGSATRSVTLHCPTDGNADLIAYCREHYGDAGYTVDVPVNQGIFVYDTLLRRDHRVAVTGSEYTNMWYWVFSGRPPGTGGGDEPSLEPPRWRQLLVRAVSGTLGGFRVAFKADTSAGATGIYLSRGPRSPSTVTVLDTSTAGTVDRPQGAGRVTGQRDRARAGRLPRKLPRPERLDAGRGHRYELRRHLPHHGAVRRHPQAGSSRTSAAKVSIARNQSSTEVRHGAATTWEMPASA